ncbi:phosphatidate cytidylyltransferase [Bacteroidia bacterium]|nr:phosphatidate cytidylyltransferase [Bacteroidia bacterium]GHT85623.1 phosphatidate cytidylyltransferase [Bacteroidia bacterium]GHU83818.1 phosphatidate cytidylyltransferase [Bacteroidia bacterium]
MKNLITRLITGIVYVALVCLGIITNSYTFLALFSLVIILCLKEFYSLINTQKKTKINLYYNCFGGLLLFVCAFLQVSETSVFPGYSIFSFYLLYIVILLIAELYEKQPDPVSHVAYILLGQLYIALPISILNLIVFRGMTTDGSPMYNSLLVLSLLVFIWVNDSGAYAIGVLFGKHRLFERISPKKSWEGFFGGLIFTLASSFIFAHFEPKIPYYHWLGLSLAIVVFGTWGDLIESLIKRTLNVKDSGQSLPGHGGYLDRFDSFLLAIYALLFYVQLFQL